MEQHAAPPRAAPEAPGAVAAAFRRSVAVVIGIDGYAAPIASLRSAVADATALADLLEEQHGFTARRVLDGAATLERLRALLRDELPGLLGPDDRLLLYFAGHGIVASSEHGPAGYLVPAGARLADPTGFLAMQELHDELVALPVRHALVILDCCFAGTFWWSSTRELASAGDRIYREQYERFLESAAWQVLTSASTSQLAFDSLIHDRRGDTGEHSPFARALLRGLGGDADLNRDGVITVDELAVFVGGELDRLLAPSGRRQSPLLFPLRKHDSGQFVFQNPTRALALEPAPELLPDRNPYRGLNAFREEDRALFFGRDELIGQLVDAVGRRRLTVVEGASGSGKSSLVRAGLLPVLGAQRRWRILRSRRPGREPLALLSGWAKKLGRPREPAADIAASWVAAAAEQARRAPDRPWLIVIDQLEELVTHRTPPADRTAFLDALAAALDASPTLHVVATVRSDTEPQFRDTALRRWWTGARFRVPRMTRAQLREAIEKPAAATILHFEPSRLVERLLDDVAEALTPLPLLSFALSELYRACWARWRAGVRDRRLADGDYEQMGGVTGALTHRASVLHDRLVAADPAYAGTIRNFFLRMVAVVGSDVARRRVPLDELDHSDPAEELRVRRVRRDFASARLISVDDLCVEPVHDELVRGWRQVRLWLDELDAAPGTHALLGALGDAVRTWRAHGKANLYLWSDGRVKLLVALGRGDRPAFAYNVHEAEFVERSAQLRQDRRIRLYRSHIDNRLLLARSYQETGRQLLLEGRAAEAVPYLLASRNRDRHPGAPLRMLFWAATRNLPVLLEHRGVVQAAAFSPDGARVATASKDHTACIWDAASGGAIHALRAHTGAIRAVAFSPDGARLATASDDHTAWVWDAGGRPLFSLAHGGFVASAAFSPDGARLVTASYDQTARVWDAATGAALSEPLRHEGAVLSALFNRAGTHVVTVSTDHTARVWAIDGQLRLRLEHGDAVRSAEFSPDGASIVTASNDRTACVWDAATARRRTTLLHHGYVASASFSPEGTRVVTASYDCTARIWHATAGEPLTGALEHRSAVRRAVFTGDGTRVATASEDGTARIWDAATGKPLTPPLPCRAAMRAAVFDRNGARLAVVGDGNTARIWDAPAGSASAPQLRHRGVVQSAAFSPDGRRVVTAGHDGVAQLWDAATGAELVALAHGERVWSAAFDHDGARVVTASYDHTACIWDAATGARVAPPLAHGDVVTSAAFSLDGARVVTASNDGAARVWCATTGVPIGQRLVHEDIVTAAAFSLDGARVVTASNDRTARVWDAATGEPLLRPLRHAQYVWSAAFAPDGARIATASWDHTARIWDAATGELVYELDHIDVVTGAAFSPDGARLVTTSYDGTARIWDARTGNPVTPPLAHGDRVVRAAFDREGTRVITASNDKTARVWDALTGKPLSEPLAHDGPVTSAGFSPDGTRVITTSFDMTARLWELPLFPEPLPGWAAIAARSPYVLIDGVLSLRR